MIKKSPDTTKPPFFRQDVKYIYIAHDQDFNGLSMLHEKNPTPLKSYLRTYMFFLLTCLSIVMCSLLIFVSEVNCMKWGVKLQYTYSTAIS